MNQTLSIRAYLLLGAFVVSLMVALVAAYAVFEQRASVNALVTAEAADLAGLVAFHAPDDGLTDLPGLASYVRRTAALFGRSIAFLDAQGQVVAASDAQQVGRLYAMDPGGEISLTLRDGVPRHFDGTTHASAGGTRCVVVPWRRHQHAEAGSIQGALVVEYAPRHTELERVVRSQALLMLPSAAVCMGLALAASLAIARRIGRPIARLHDAAAGIAEGRFDSQVVAEGPREIAGLAVTFNRMARELVQYREQLTARGRDLEVSIQERTAELARANADLRDKAEALARRNQEMTAFGGINEFLQASNTEQEAYQVLAQSTAQLFPGDSGAVYVLSASRDALERASSWGADAPSPAEFGPDECWALRRGKAHMVTGQEPRCSHVSSPDQQYLCLPLLAHGETLGILHLVDAHGDGSLPERYRLANTLAESVSLAIANLRLRDAMRNLSMRDALTGLYNRRYVEEVLPQECHRARRQHTQVAVLMIDLDHFKRFNDSFGHDAGDTVLRELGQYLRRQVRESDVACRYGGEEFMVILGAATPEGAQQRAEELCAGVRRLEIIHDAQLLGPVTMSVGVAMFPDHGNDPEAVVKAADTALYRAKHSGRDRVAMYHPPGADPPAAGPAGG